MSDIESSVPPWEQGGSKPEDHKKGFDELVDLAKLKSPVTKMRIAGLRAGLPPSRMNSLIKDAQDEAAKLLRQEFEEAEESAQDQQPAEADVQPAPEKPPEDHTPAAPTSHQPVEPTTISSPEVDTDVDENAAYEELLKQALNGVDISLLEKVADDFGLTSSMRSELIARAQTEAGDILNFDSE